MAKICPQNHSYVLYLDCLECDNKICIKNKKVLDRPSGDSKIVIGIDQSYQDTGISISFNGNLKNAKSIYLKNLKNNTEKRNKLKEQLNKTFEGVKEISNKYNAEVIVIIERIRLQSQGFLNIDYIKSIGALNALIVDIAKSYDYSIYSVDTRAWKSAIVGNSKGQKNKYGFDEKKWPTIIWCCRKGYEKYIKLEITNNKKKKAIIEKEGERYTYNDNIADSICISLYGFIQNPLLKEEH